jgi:hypothetical protein
MDHLTAAVTAASKGMLWSCFLSCSKLVRLSLAEDFDLLLRLVVGL